MKTIAVLVTGVAWKPLGGLKVIYEYANKLTDEGATINIYYSVSSDFGQYNFKLRLKSFIKFIYFKFFKDFKCRNWFKLDGKIKEHLVWKLTEDSIGEHDCYIATTVQSAVFLSKFLRVDNLKKFYFIQGFENWSYGITDDMVYESYRYPMNKIVIANWLKDKVSEVGHTCSFVPNGFDSNKYYISNAINNRTRTSICMMYNTKLSKGCNDCFKALEVVKNEVPTINVNIFGIPPRPDFLPDWYNYVQLPSPQQLRELYNDSAIFVGASHSEGWGLTIGEAMMCGCAVACTDNAGYMEMAHNNETALVSRTKHPDELAENILRLLRNDELRKKLATRGNAFIQSLDSVSSYNKFKKAIGWNSL